MIYVREEGLNWSKKMKPKPWEGKHWLEVESVIREMCIAYEGYEGWADEKAALNKLIKALKMDYEEENNGLDKP